MLISLFSFSVTFRKVYALVVDDDGPADFASIQAAINAAANGDTVFVKNGTYYENVVVNKTINLLGEAREATIVDGLQKEFVFAITAFGVVVDGFTLRNANQTDSTIGFGIIANNTKDCIIRNNLFTLNYYGVKLVSCINVTFEDNMVDSNPFFGSVLENSSNCTVKRNLIHNNMYTGIAINKCSEVLSVDNDLARSNRGIHVIGSSNCTLENTTLANIVYYGVEIVSSSNVQLINSTVNDNFHLGVSIQNSVNCTVARSFLNNNKNFYALEIVGSNSCRIADNVLANNFYGVMLERSDFCTLSGNVVSNSSYGIQLYFTSNSTLSHNIVSNMSNYALFLTSSSNCTLNANTIRDNRYYGVWMDNSSGNTLFHNNFVKNRYQAFVSASANVWNQTAEGNYWSNYNKADLDFDGVGDEAYTIGENNVDYHPLLGTFYSFNITVFSYPKEKIEEIQLISNSTASDLKLCVWLSSPNEFLQPGQLFILFNVSGENATSGFCRMTLPKNVLNTSSYVVLVEWQKANVTVLSTSNSTHDCLYFTYNHSTKEVIVTVPEFSFVACLFLFLLTLVFAKLRQSNHGWVSRAKNRRTLPC
ncbi:MAG: NosD domain-containing protein [Candidatus Bathyarchaeia archaeon]